MICLQYQYVPMARPQGDIGGRVALYDITVRDEQTGELVAKSQDLAYRKNERFVK